MYYSDVPARPTGMADWEQITEALRASSCSFVDRATMEGLLGISRRRAQQLLAPCVTDRVGPMDSLNEKA